MYYIINYKHPEGFPALTLYEKYEKGLITFWLYLTIEVWATLFIFWFYLLLVFTMRVIFTLSMKDYCL